MIKYSLSLVVSATYFSPTPFCSYEGPKYLTWKAEKNDSLSFEETVRSPRDPVKWILIIGLDTRTTNEIH